MSTHNACLRRRKGQTLTPDFLVGLAVFGAVLVFGMSMFATTYFNNAEFQQFEAVQRQSVDLMDVMVRTPGSPSTWTNETVKIVGLVSQDHVLSGEKLVELKKISEERLREIFGLGEHSFYLTIENETGIVVYAGTELSYGSPPPSAAETVIYTVRHASLFNEGNRTTVALKFKVWE